MKIRLLRKLGQNPIGAVIDRTHQEAEQLIRQNFAVHAPSEDAQADMDEGGDQGEANPDANQQGGTQNEGTGPTAADLRDHAAKLQISTSGTKAQLSERIEKHIAEHGDQPAPAN